MNIDSTFAKVDQIFSYLDLSTGHLSQKTLEFIESITGQNVIGTTVASYEHGVFVAVPGREEGEAWNEAIPADLRKVMEFAEAHQCFVLRFDASADQIASLPFYPDHPSGINAEVHDDSHAKSAVFDAAPWFAIASDKAIVELHDIGWRGDYPADEVALFFESGNVDIADLFDFCRASQRTNSPIGFECSVDSENAMEWLKENRAGLWAQLLCSKESELSLRFDEEDKAWQWFQENTNGYSCSFDRFKTIEEAALDAVKVRCLDEHFDI